MRKLILSLFFGVSILALAGCNKEGNDTEETTEGGAVVTLSERTETSQIDQTETESHSTAPQKTRVTEKSEVSGTAGANENVDDVIDTVAADKVELTAAKPVKVIPAVFNVSRPAQAPAETKTVAVEDKRASTVDAAIAAAMRDSSENEEPRPAVKVLQTVESAKTSKQEKRVETVEYTDPLNRIPTVTERTVWTESPRKTRSRSEPSVIVTETVVSSGESTHRTTRSSSYTVYGETSSTQCFTGG